MLYCKGHIAVLLGMMVVFGSAPLIAQDARTLALGGSSISEASGVAGAVQNPALLANQKRDGQKIHFLLGTRVDLRDENDLFTELENNKDLLENFESEIDTLSDQALTCTPLDGAQTTCLTGTNALAGLAEDILNLFDAADSQKLEARAVATFGFSIPSMKIPVGFFIQTSATITGFSDISDGDKDYVSGIASVLSDNILSVQDLQDSTALTYNTSNNTVDIALPDDVLTSEAEGGAVIRVQTGASFALPATFGNFNFDVGVTPKFSKLTASNLKIAVRDIENGDDLQQKFEESELSESSFTLDLGASAELGFLNALRAGVVIRNLLPESITAGGRKFETTPQMIIGASFNAGLFKLTSDLALNEAKYDNLASQTFNAGAEIGFNWLALRAGIQHDFSIDNQPTSLAVGAGLGAFDISAQTNGGSSLQASASISFGF